MQEKTQWNCPPLANFKRRRQATQINLNRFQGYIVKELVNLLHGPDSDSDFDKLGVYLGCYSTSEIEDNPEIYFKDIMEWLFDAGYYNISWQLDRTPSIPRVGVTLYIDFT
jgi:hypothetical protein